MSGMRFVRAVLTLVIVLTLTIFALRFLFPLPPMPNAPVSKAIPASADTTMGAAIAPMAAEHSELSGIVPLADGRDAFVVRVLLSQAAEVSIDVQYYIWHMDTTGWILLDELRAAAERGVRVRLLLDDNGIPGLDNVLAGLNELPNVEVRIFNPFTLRNPKLASFVFDFPRLNRRMHNKSMTVDGVSTIIGGRNIGDIYFAYGDDTAYFDLDVLAVGPAAKAVSTDFDVYWASDSSYPAEDILRPSEGGLAELQAAGVKARETARGSDYVEAINASPLVRNLVSGNQTLEWSNVTLVSDDPAKGLGKAAAEDWLIGKLPGLLSRPKHDADLVSAYLIPGKEGTELLKSYVADGVDARVVTNSLEATDVPIVHSAWMKYRGELIDAGVEVLELRARPDLQDPQSFAHLLAGSLSSLHAKTFALDNERIFIGSFNFDPRSAALNTEMGFLIESERLATGLLRAIERRDLLYRVTRTRAGNLAWVETTASGEVIEHPTEPGTSFWRRALVHALSCLPVEWML